MTRVLSLAALAAALLVALRIVLTVVGYITDAYAQTTLGVVGLLAAVVVGIIRFVTHPWGPFAACLAVIAVLCIRDGIRIRREIRSEQTVGAPTS